MCYLESALLPKAWVFSHVALWMVVDPITGSVMLQGNNIEVEVVKRMIVNYYFYKTGCSDTTP